MYFSYPPFYLVKLINFIHICKKIFIIMFLSDVGVVKLSHPFFFIILVRILKFFLKKSAFFENS